MYRIYLSNDFAIWERKDILPCMEEKHIGEYDTMPEALIAQKRFKDWFKTLESFPDWMANIWIG